MKDLSRHHSTSEMPSSVLPAGPDRLVPTHPGGGDPDGPGSSRRSGIWIEVVGLAVAAAGWAVVIALITQIA